MWVPLGTKHQADWMTSRHRVQTDAKRTTPDGNPRVVCAGRDLFPQKPPDPAHQPDPSSRLPSLTGRPSLTAHLKRPRSPPAHCLHSALCSPPDVTSHTGQGLSQGDLVSACGGQTSRRPRQLPCERAACPALLLFPMKDPLLLTPATDSEAQFTHLQRSSRWLCRSAFL